MSLDSLRGGGRPLIEGVHAREILDSRGNPTVAVTVATSFGAVEEAMVPSGASTGAHEAVELRDGDKNRYGGKGRAQGRCRGQRRARPRARRVGCNRAARDRRASHRVRRFPNKSTLGANAMLGTSLAVARAAASSLSLPLFRYLGGPCAATLPVPMMNVVNGGKHAGGALQFQEIMIVPLGAASESDAVRCGAEVFHALGTLLHDRHFRPSSATRAVMRRRSRTRRKLWISSSPRSTSPGTKPAGRRFCAGSCVERVLSRRQVLRPFEREGHLQRRDDRHSIAISAIAIRSCRSRTVLPKTIGPVGTN